MNRQDLKEYRYTEIWIKDRQEHLKEKKTTLENISAIVSDMPKRKQTNTRWICRKASRFIG